ncbi:hypothetical protein K493DRAFT_299176 [Basidiobolus meristosporus CBS 931.73]|uniref:Uncharacterized protein n=1 Tax=Basidiobolus meristosporus CBS 931.73 TaxID=1314790 RepID=A0A1Y1YPB1_9FUNG|nr:hypothetical protein K493DRAFT_299176 [Basidiobolus meristosporus CBS 931.73]|eukprot:ORX99867.1 hypothetical protein K493DRAFT_299176 [Basidiobolus meristosporus CBS 931.73]
MKILEGPPMYSLYHWLVRVTIIAPLWLSPVTATIQLSQYANQLTMTPDLPLNYPSYDFYEDSPGFYNYSAILLRAELSSNCQLTPVPLRNNSQPTLPDASSSVVKQLNGYAKLMQGLSYPSLKVALFTTALDSSYTIGNLYHESYGNYPKSKSDGVYLALVAKDHGLILGNLIDSANKPLSIQIWEDPGPWNQLLKSVGFAVMRWTYFAIVNGVLGQISIYFSWLVGYWVYGGLLLAWCRVILNMQHRPRNLRPFYLMLYFSMINFTVVITLMVAGLTLLAFATIPGWLLLMLTALLLASTLTSTVAGYVTNMIAYKLAGFQLYGVFFLILTLGENHQEAEMQKLPNDSSSSHQEVQENGLKV